MRSKSLPAPGHGAFSPPRVTLPNPATAAAAAASLSLTYVHVAFYVLLPTLLPACNLYSLKIT